MLTIETQIRELRAELADCFLTRRERVQAQAQLNALFGRIEREQAVDAPSVTVTPRTMV